MIFKFLSSIYHPIQWRNWRFDPGREQSLDEGGPLVTIAGPLAKTQKKS